MPSVRTLNQFLALASVVVLASACNAPAVPETTPVPVAESAVGPTGGKEKTMESSKLEVATFGGGCFWCLEAVFEKLEGVEKVVSGYTGGSVISPTYHQVCTGTTDHAEVIQVTFDPSVIAYRDLLDVFFAMHDPTTLNRQGADVGTQYRSALFTQSDEQKRTAEATIKELDKEGIWSSPIVTEVVPLETFYSAEDYHQGYYRANPNQGYCVAVINPKVAKLRAKFADKLKK